MEEREVLRIAELLIEPSATCPLNAPLHIRMVYDLLEPVPQASWEMVYEADFTNKRQSIHIHQTHAGDLAPGRHMFEHAVDTIKTDAVKEKYLLQVGVLKLLLRSAVDPSVSASVNMVTQVSKDSASGQLLRSILSPLE